MPLRTKNATLSPKPLPGFGISELLECPVCECRPELCGSERAKVFWVICDLCGSKSRWRPTKEDAAKEWNGAVKRHSNNDYTTKKEPQSHIEVKTKSETKSRKRRVVSAKMVIHENGTASFRVRGYDFRWADMPITVNEYMFAPVRAERRSLVEEVERLRKEVDLRAEPNPTGTISARLNWWKARCDELMKLSL